MQACAGCHGLSSTRASQAPTARVPKTEPVAPGVRIDPGRGKKGGRSAFYGPESKKRYVPLFSPSGLHPESRPYQPERYEADRDGQAREAEPVAPAGVT